MLRVWVHVYGGGIHLIINVKLECLPKTLMHVLLYVHVHRIMVYETNITSVFKSRKMSYKSPMNLISVLRYFSCFSFPPKLIS